MPPTQRPIGELFSQRILRRKLLQLNKLHNTITTRDVLSRSLGQTHRNGIIAYFPAIWRK